MKINKALLLIGIFAVFAIKSSAELEQLIIKTDTEGVKKLLPTVELDAQQKVRLDPSCK